MNAPSMSRRALCGALTGVAGFAAIGVPGIASPAVTGGTLSPLRRYMKVYASLQPETLYYWYSGTLELAPQDASIVPLAGIETLIRRELAGWL